MDNFRSKHSYQQVDSAPRTPSPPPKGHFPPGTRPIELRPIPRLQTSDLPSPPRRPPSQSGSGSNTNTYRSNRSRSGRPSRRPSNAYSFVNTPTELSYPDDRLNRVYGLIPGSDDTSTISAHSAYPHDPHKPPKFSQTPPPIRHPEYIHHNPEYNAALEVTPSEHILPASAPQLDRTRETPIVIDTANILDTGPGDTQKILWDPSPILESSLDPSKLALEPTYWENSDLMGIPLHHSEPPVTYYNRARSIPGGGFVERKKGVWGVRRKWWAVIVVLLLCVVGGVGGGVGAYLASMKNRENANAAASASATPETAATGEGEGKTE